MWMDISIIMERTEMTMEDVCLIETDDSKDFCLFVCLQFLFYCFKGYKVGLSFLFHLLAF